MDCNVSELVKRGHDQAAELKASFGAVDVRDVAQLISDLVTQLDVQLARSNALAAENAVIKECNTDIMKHVYRSKTYLESSRVVDAIQGLQCAIERKSGKTPATDAFLAEVRASAVDDVCLEISNAIINCYQDELVGLDMAATICGDFASELRKGVQS
ncbi:hypothetical protein [Enterobacter cloacae complex sp. 2024EL-00227]|uniref:hypothetical protein n=1 Tax=Enterobacter cloacae complex sp. 2024EL-00227 TaxID=3374272 RepID=UPI0037521D37